MVTVHQRWHRHLPCKPSS